MGRLLSVVTLLWAGVVCAADLPTLKINEVKEIAPGVFFRFSSIGPEGSNIPFGGSNNIWVVFEDYVVVIDANFPKEAADVIEAVKKTTTKPIRYVFDTHHHGDHAFGNAVFAKEGASIIAQAHCAHEMRVNGPEAFKKEGSGPTGRKDVAGSTLKVPNVVFDDKLVLDDGKQRVEFLHFGHSHTRGDAVAYLPKHKILCTGDACLNGPYNYTGHSDTASWIRALEGMQQLEIEILCPGHGPLASKELLAKQKRYFVELRAHVQKGIDAGQTLEEITKNLDMPWYKEWTTVEARSRKENLEHVFGELTGRLPAMNLLEQYGLTAGPSPTKESPGWTKPKRIVVPNLMPAKLQELKRLAPDVEFVPAKTVEEAAKLAGEADAVIGYCSTEIAQAGSKLRWIQTGSAGVEKDLTPAVVQSKITLTNTQRIYGPQVADQAFALLLALTRGKPASTFSPGDFKPQELQGKTMLVVGMGGLGTEISRRAHAFGMRVQGVDPKEQPKPSYVFSLHQPSELVKLLPSADVIVLACPLTTETKGLFGAEQFKACKPTAWLVNVARGGVVQTEALAVALHKKQIAGAGLDVTDPEPLPHKHPLWDFPNVVISPHIGGQSPEARERQWLLWRENIRRFVAGEPLLCVVDKQKGY